MLQLQSLRSLYSSSETDRHHSPSQSRQQDYRATKFSIMRQGGHTVGNITSGLLLDALSVGTQYNLKLLEAQSQTWASHRSIRHYFAATELDDADKTCYKTLNRAMIEQIVDLCVNEQPLVKERGMRIQYKKSFSKGQFMQRGAGWMCAQQRFAVAVETLGNLYRKQLQVEGWTLPDFILMQDDDTYYNMVKIEDFLIDKDPSIPLAEAPCLIRHTQEYDFSFPWGGKCVGRLVFGETRVCKVSENLPFFSSGYGFILSRGAIENLIRPIYCNNTSESDEFERNVCSRLEDDVLGERQYFRNGMSVSDLMGAQVRNNFFTRFSRENWAYCLHGDWVLGYFVNYYYISSPTKDAGFENVPEVRIEGTLGGTFKEDKGNCIYGSVDMCTEAAHVCHRQTAKSMATRTREVAAKAPGAFPNFSIEQ